ncbi:hypothetical protein P8C59_006625 [Phyllachora maydis]|uniref:Nicotinamide N-methyltransferase n=1 Tax=Phyllachora maydis TaxID=1825666 RepID=A0AAD9MFP9_9PEZI|nr:hypothetical protein P8C59_006625 [Phyllachora maydis]
MALTSRLAPAGPPETEPEDFMASALGVIFPDDVINMHGDADHGLLYTSPHLPRPIHIRLADVQAEADRRLFSHHLWNASLLLAELLEAGTLHLPPPAGFDVAGLATAELGAGAALPSIMAALLGARRVLVTDYPSEPVLATLRRNVAAATQPAMFPAARPAPDVRVAGHAWGDLRLADDPDADEAGDAEPVAGCFDRVLVADCLWMPWRHADLHRSVAWLLRHDGDARAWVVAGFHTGRAQMRGFFDPAALADVGLEVERLWERDCEGRERAWAWDRGGEDVGARKRWLAVGVLRRVRRAMVDGEV